MFKSVINDTFEKLWDEASWIATGFAFSPDEQAAMAFVFQNEKQGLEIFRQWQAQLGKADGDELLRVAIIEGDIPEQAPGYTIHLTTNLRAVLKEKDIADLKDDMQIQMMSRYQRLQPQEQGLDRFKTTFAQRKEYIILPAFYIESNIQPHFELAILKREVHFRDAQDISQQDIDSVVFNTYGK